jgi:hypothetical protein
MPLWKESDNQFMVNKLKNALQSLVDNVERDIQYHVSSNNAETWKALGDAKAALAEKTIPTCECGLVNMTYARLIAADGATHTKKECKPLHHYNSDCHGTPASAAQKHNPDTEMPIKELLAPPSPKSAWDGPPYKMNVLNAMADETRAKERRGWEQIRPEVDRRAEPGVFGLGTCHAHSPLHSLEYCVKEGHGYMWKPQEVPPKPCGSAYNCVCGQGCEKQHRCEEECCLPK